MKVLHTADWHLGMTLCGRRRDAEAEAFLTWLADIIHREDVDLLLVTGDIFDNGTQSARSQTLYYQFLTAAAAAGCRHIIITAGNHDSPAFLEAPQEILAALNIHVVGTAGEGRPGNTFLLNGPDGEPDLIVAAVPYLRDRDIRRSVPGSSIHERAGRMREGVRSLYREAWDAACAMQPSTGPAVPVIITGHLFVAGGTTIDGDGVREQVAGFIERVGADIFAEEAAYVALGHLHVPQTVAGIETIRYPGSPVPVGFGEAEQQKEVILVTTMPGMPAAVRSVPVPQFHRLATIQGDLPTISRRIHALREDGGPVWAEVIYDGAAIPGDLMGEVTAMAEGTEIEILKVKDARLVSAALSAYQSCEELAELTETEVFERCMETADIPPDQQGRLMTAFREVLRELDADEPFGGAPL
ncbi:exonuclease SbcCD subunit D C-terminal domain-containing protein [Methanogenium sp. S4BF]|uniref:exonuclease SbcCD subunit D C-terminal domain-containing protein n=1 Tax=Methanogenium sp. S4BF TaxID=1789226 RepID=UPI002417FBA1|nr:exonuclease SbcCD subunit D C-terminal domain-containing protein [Methanogenium sp. S4BF]